MSIYVMSDLHGNYDAYINMLEKINFKNTDTLYIIGDILDRGPNPIKILLDLMKRPNIKTIAGNHCVMACECLGFLLQEITDKTVEKLDIEIVEKLLNWQQNGAMSTTDEFHKCDRNTQREIVEFISDLELYAQVEVNGITYILVHAGLANFTQDKQLWEYELDELVWERTNYEEKYYDDKIVITGHTPTMLIENNPRPGFIYKANNHIAIDCGCGFPKGRLGCIRLDDMKEFYVEVVK